MITFADAMLWSALAFACGITIGLTIGVRLTIQPVYKVNGKFATKEKFEEAKHDNY